jgi:hypothetical protein
MKLLGRDGGKKRKSLGHPKSTTIVHINVTGMGTIDICKNEKYIS